MIDNHVMKDQPLDGSKDMSDADVLSTDDASLLSFPLKCSCLLSSQSSIFQFRASENLCQDTGRRAQVSALSERGIQVHHQQTMQVQKSFSLFRVNSLHCFQMSERCDGAFWSADRGQVRG